MKGGEKEMGEVTTKEYQQMNALMDEKINKLTEGLNPLQRVVL